MSQRYETRVDVVLQVPGAVVAAALALHLLTAGMLVATHSLATLTLALAVAISAGCWIRRHVWQQPWSHLSWDGFGAARLHSSHGDNVGAELDLLESAFVSRWMVVLRVRLHGSLIYLPVYAQQNKEKFRLLNQRLKAGRLMPAAPESLVDSQ